MNFTSSLRQSIGDAPLSEWGLKSLTFTWTKTTLLCEIIKAPATQENLPQDPRAAPAKIWQNTKSFFLVWDGVISASSLLFMLFF